jgi:DNA-binding transcriptional LysR family regulator
MTPSAVSRSISRLEKHLGGRVLNRTTRAMSVTEFGREVYAACARLADAASHVQRLARQYEGSPRGRLRVTAPVSWGQARLVPRVASFMAKWPEVDVDVELSDRVVDLVSENFDVAIRISPKLPSGMVARRIGMIHYHLVASPRCTPEIDGIAGPQDLLRFDDMLWGEHGTEQLDFVNTDGTCESVALSPRVRLNSSVTIAAALEHTRGIGLVADFAAAAAISAGRLKRVLEGWSLSGAYQAIPVHAVYAPIHHIAPKTRAFIDHVTGTESFTAQNVRAAPGWNGAAVQSGARTSVYS